jgi:hypothetical protein
MKNKTKTGYHYACVIKDNKYHELVIVNEFDDGTEEVYAYTLQDDETLIKAQPPVKKFHAESVGFVAPAWNGTEWVEGATAEEIAQWNNEHPAPEPPEPTEMELLQDEVTALQLALCDQYEENLALQEEVTNTQLALVELYEGGIA